MHPLLLIVAAIAVLAIGLFLGVTALLLAPLIGVVVFFVLIVWVVRRRAQHRPPM